MEIFGFLIPIFPELLTIVLGLVIVYLVILELEFRQARRITEKFSQEESTLEREIKEFRTYLDEFKSGVLQIDSELGETAASNPGAGPEKNPIGDVVGEILADKSLKKQLTEKGLSKSARKDRLRKMVLKRAK